MQRSCGTLFTTDVTIDTPNFIRAMPTRLAARRYTTSPTPPAQGLTLVCLHAVCAHKEHWEPTIDRLFALQKQSGRDIIREVWSIDWQSHGDSAVLNQELFASEPNAKSDGPETGAAIVTFVRDHLASHRVVYVGHSGGALIGLSSTVLYRDIQHIPYECMILAEPGMIDQQSFVESIKHRTRFERFIRGVMNQRDEWDSREAAYEWFKGRSPWKTWDPRIIRICADAGLRPSVTGSTRVRSKSSRIHEAKCMMEFQSMFQSVAQIERICHVVPLHFILGEQHDHALGNYGPSLTDASKGRVPASVSVVTGAGHMVVQQQPDRVADLIWAIIADVHSRPPRVEVNLVTERPPQTRL